MNLNAIRISGGYNYVPCKLFLVMKITTFILLISVLTVSASTYAQKITLNEKKASLDEVLAKIRQQSGYDVIYSNDVLEKSTPVTIKITDATLEDALKASLQNQPLTYEIEEKTILIKMKESSFINKLKDFLALIDVHGRVVDEKGQPLAGVTVKLKDETHVVITDKDGNFILTKVNDNAAIVISSIGYLTKEINAKAELGTVALEVSNSKLDEVQVIAYGTTTRRFSTGNISSVKAEDIAKATTSNPLLAIEGRVPGIFIQQTGGNTIGNVQVTVQGKNSIARGNDPFYVIDGLPYINSNLGNPISGNLLPTAAGNSTLSFINPADIESIEILKDADATAIYGSRAANGAILITTKKGKAGETKVDLNMQNGWGSITRKYNLLNTDQYIAMRLEELKNDGIPIDPSDYDINGIWDSKRNVDWQKTLAGGTAHYTNISTSVSGGNNNTQFRVGAGYIRQSTVYLGDYADKKNNVSIGINHKSSNKKFTFNISGNYLQDNNRLPGDDPYTYALMLAPDAPELFKPDGTLNWSPLPSDPSAYTFDNPATSFVVNYNTKTSNLISNSLIAYEFLPGLTIKSSFGYNKMESNDSKLIPLTATRPDRTGTRSGQYSTRDFNSWIAEPQINFARQYSFGHIDALVGATFQQNTTDALNLEAKGFNSDAELANIAAASTVNVSTTIQSLYRYSALFGRINYTFRDKYIVNLTARRDGSSRFGQENLFHNFFSIGGAWIFTEENFIKSLFPFLNYGKIRASYGTTGNDQIGDYTFLNLYTNQTYTLNYQNTVGLVPTGLTNPYLQWEETRKLNLGVDLGFFDNGLIINANYYRNRSSNQLLRSPLPIASGFGTILQNLPATVQNSGFEVSIEANPIRKENFSWQITGNFTMPKNKLISFPGIDQTSYANSLVVGEPITIQKVFQFAGVDSQTGYYQFKDSKGGLTSYPDYSSDRTVLINTQPKWYAGFSNTISYKGLSFDFLLQYVRQIQPDVKLQAYVPGYFNTNASTYVLNRWQKLGDTGPAQIITLADLSSYDAAQLSNAFYSDASYLRLKNASISFSLPSRWTDKLHFSQCRIYLQGQNLLTITKYEGDPETGYGSLPPLRVYTLGLQLTF
jgi:TonB-linked SusC/RagA family outer membrane protein